MEYALAWLLSMVLFLIEFCNGVKLPLSFCNEQCALLPEIILRIKELCVTEKDMVE